MSSRRLDISSLLCSDSVPPSFQALVHAASEERRRLDQQDHRQDHNYHDYHNYHDHHDHHDQQQQQQQQQRQQQHHRDHHGQQQQQQQHHHHRHHHQQQQQQHHYLHPQPPPKKQRLSLSPPITHHSARRSPPGSQIGRITAARKSDEARRTDDAVAVAAAATMANVRNNHPRTFDNPIPTQDRPPPHDPWKDPPRKMSLDVVMNQPTSLLNLHHQDPHDWLLDHYVPSPHTLHSEPPRSPSPSISPVFAKLHPQRVSPTLQPQPSTSHSPDPDVALEQELAELMAEQEQYKPEPDDMDIDPPLAPLIEQDDQSKIVSDDVENELLSLLDDRPLAGPEVATPTTLAPLDQPKPLSPLPLPATSPSTASPVMPPPFGSDRGSMPPPAAAVVAPVLPRGKDKDDDALVKSESVDAISARKKKDVENKVVAKKTKEAIHSAATQMTTNHKQQKTKSVSNKKTKALEGSIVPAAVLTKQSKASAGAKKPAAASRIDASRSRSTSVMASGSVEPELERKSEEKEEEEAADDKLYCVCETKYDEDRFMIACDRCDEWYHTACVNMPESEVELVDQFFCPPCIEQNPHMNLKTTYKQRCLNGLRHPDPDSSKACHKPARGAISKYCSDECGVEYMQSRIDAWAKKGGQKEELWESVKKAEKREGIAVCVDEKIKSGLDDKNKKQSRMDRETERLQGVLNQVVKVREETRDSMEIIAWREQLLQLASERAEHIDQCGWDQRLCFGEEEWQTYGAGVVESYEVRDENDEEDGEWWCSGQKSCKRHNGWQTLRYKDICKEREKKEELLNSLVIRERQLRKRIEDLIVDHSGRKSNTSASHVPLKSSNTKLPNGHTKSNESLKKGKKRKVPVS